MPMAGASEVDFPDLIKKYNAIQMKLLNLNDYRIRLRLGC